MEGKWHYFVEEIDDNLFSHHTLLLVLISVLVQLLSIKLIVVLPYKITTIHGHIFVFNQIFPKHMVVLFIIPYYNSPKHNTTQDDTTQTKHYIKLINIKHHWTLNNK